MPHKKLRKTDKQRASEEAITVAIETVLKESIPILQQLKGFIYQNQNFLGVFVKQKSNMPNTENSAK